MLAHDIGRAVEAARKRLDMSLDDLAERTSIDADLLASVERGERLASTAKLDRVASTLGLDAFALYSGREVQQGLVVLPRYAARSDFQHEDLSVLRLALERATALLDVSSILGKKSLASQFEPRTPGAEPAKDGYHLAKRVRVALGNTTEPLLNLQGLLAEKFNVPVLEASLATGVLLAAAVRSSAVRAGAVVLNTSVKDGPTPRSPQAWLVDRVSICHELCHVLFDEPKGGVVDVVLDDPPREGQDRSPIEKRAGAFAAELLIPQHGLKKLLGSEGCEVSTPSRADHMVDEVRAHFGTPAEIAVNHLYNHGYVARESSFREELIDSAQKRELPQVSAQFAGEIDAWYRVLLARTREAHDSCLITDGTARALLEVSAGEPLPWECEAS
jgi:transcriptional regulator with XRE-family HTH domain/Zn-dependent peptidase ImmA (M78 family)